MRYSEIIGFKMPARVRAALNNIEYYPFHLHEDVLEIVCVLDGTLNVHDSALDYDLAFGDIYIVNARDPHKLAGDAGNITLTVQIDLSHYAQYYGDMNLVVDPYFVCDSFQKNASYSDDIKYLRFLLAQIYSAYSAENPANIEIESFTRDLIDHLISDYTDYVYAKNNGKYRIVRKQNDKTDEKYFYRIYKIIDYIVEHYNEKVTLSDLAEREYLSEAYLSRFIKAASGLTFSELLSLTRCEEAERLLSTTNGTLDHIATQVGFAGRSNLTTQFKKWFGKTPTAYRRSINEDLTNHTRISYGTFDYDFAMRIIDSYRDGY